MDNAILNNQTRSIELRGVVDVRFTVGDGEYSRVGLRRRVWVGGGGGAERRGGPRAVHGGDGGGAPGVNPVRDHDREHDHDHHHTVTKPDLTCPYLTSPYHSRRVLGHG